MTAPDPTTLRGQLRAWFDSPLGRSLQAVEAYNLRAVLPTLYGTVAVQLGSIGKLDLMDACTAPARIVLDVLSNAPRNGQVKQTTDVGLVGAAPSWVLGTPDALPFDTRSVDVALLPHTLDFSPEPHQVLREVNRCLGPEGHVVILGFNLMSLWGVRRLLTSQPRPMPWRGNFLSLGRIKDWLALLDFEFTHGSMLYYRPPLQRESIMERLYFLDQAGDRWWPLMAAVYLVVAKKRVMGVTPLPVAWKTKRMGVGVTEPVARRLLQRTNERCFRRYG